LIEEVGGGQRGEGEGWGVRTCGRHKKTRVAPCKMIHQHIHTHIHTHTHTHTHTRAHAHTRTHVSIYSHVIRTHARTYVCDACCCKTWGICIFAGRCVRVCTYRCVRACARACENCVCERVVCVCARICVCAVSLYLQNWLEMFNSRDAQLTFYYFHIFLWGEGVSVNDVYSRMHA